MDWSSRQPQSWQDTSWGKSGKGGKGGSWNAPSWSDGGSGDGCWGSVDAWSSGKGASDDGGWWPSPGDWGKPSGKGCGGDAGWQPDSSGWGKASAKGAQTSPSPSWRPSAGPIVKGDSNQPGKGYSAPSSAAGRPPARVVPPSAVSTASSTTGAWRPRSELPAITARGDGLNIPQITPNTVTLQAAGLQTTGEAAVDEACRQIAIDGGFSVHETLTFLNNGAAHLEFPHAAAAAQFFEATGGDLVIGRSRCRVRHPLGTGVVPEPRRVVATIPEAWQSGDPDEEIATDTLMIKNLAEIPEADLREAFEKIAPRIKSVRVIKDYAGHHKGMGQVSFHEIHEATMALRHFRLAGCMVAGRKTTAEYLAPSTIEQKVEQEDKKQKADESLRASHAQALSGVNGDMWASYLAMFNNGGSGEAQQSEAKRPRTGGYW